MSQGRTNTQIEATNKLMVTFLIAMLVFITSAYIFSLVERESKWLQHIEREIIAKNP